MRLRQFQVVFATTLAGALTLACSDSDVETATDVSEDGQGQDGSVEDASEDSGDGTDLASFDDAGEDNIADELELDVTQEPDVIVSPPEFTWNSMVLISEEDSPTVMTALIGDSIAVVGETVHVVWVSAISESTTAVYYRRSDDRGENWGDVQQLTAEGLQAAEPTVGARGQDVYVTFRDTAESEDGMIYFKGSLNNGETWGDDILLSIPEVRSAAASMTLDADNIYVSWENYLLGPGNPRIRISSDRGLTFGEGIDVTRGTLDAGGEGCPSLTVGSQNQINIVHCSLRDAGDTRNYNWELYHNQSTDFGQTWNDDSVRLTNDAIGDSRFPVATASGRNLHVVWWDDRDDTNYSHEGYPPIEPEPDHNFEIYYKRSTDDGSTFGPDIRLTTYEGVARCPSIAADGPLVYVVWQDNVYGQGDEGYVNEEILFVASGDNGTTWEDSIRLTDHFGPSSWPSVVMDDAVSAYVLWTDRQGDRREIYFMRGDLIR